MAESDFAGAHACEINCQAQIRFVGRRRLPHRSNSSLGTIEPMAKLTLRTASIWCLAIWAAVWCLFMLIRFSGIDIRVIPGIGPIMLVALVISIIGPAVAIVIVGVSLIRRPRSALSWLILASAVVACFAVVGIYTAMKWL